MGAKKKNLAKSKKGRSVEEMKETFRKQAREVREQNGSFHFTFAQPRSYDDLLINVVKTFGVGAFCVIGASGLKQLHSRWCASTREINGEHHKEEDFDLTPLFDDIKKILGKDE